MIREQFEYATEYEYDRYSPRQRRMGLAALACFVIVGLGLWAWLR